MYRQSTKLTHRHGGIVTDVEIDASAFTVTSADTSTSQIFLETPIFADVPAVIESVWVMGSARQLQLLTPGGGGTTWLIQKGSVLVAQKGTVRKGEGPHGGFHH